MSLVQHDNISSSSEKTDSQKGVERRRRKRVKVAAQLRVRPTDANAEPFLEVAMTIDVSRDGILFSTTRQEFHKGMPVGVTFPYSTAPNALNSEQAAEVVRIIDLGEGQTGVAVQFTHASQQAAAAIATTGPGSKEKSTVRGASSSAKGAMQQSTVRRPIVLVVEDDLRAQEQLKTLLTPEGYDVFAVKTGAEALDILRTTVPACFIAEIEAVDTSGYDLCLIIKRSERLAHVPVVLVTRNAKPADYAASREFGAVVCMAKPFQPERMLQVVRMIAPSPLASEGKPAYRGEATIDRLV